MATTVITDMFLQQTASLIIDGTAPRPAKIAIGTATGTSAPASEADMQSATALAAQIYSDTFDIVTVDSDDDRLSVFGITVGSADAQGTWTEIGILDDNDILLLYGYEASGYLTKGTAAVIVQCKVGIR